MDIRKLRLEVKPCNIKNRLKNGKEKDSSRPAKFVRPGEKIVAESLESGWGADARV
jgi:hypothetical protein